MNAALRTYSAVYFINNEGLQAFAKAMRALAQLEPSRDKFIREAFQRGHTSEWRLDDEAIRPIVPRSIRMPICNISTSKLFDGGMKAAPPLQQSRRSCTAYESAS